MSMTSSADQEADAVNRDEPISGHLACELDRPPGLDALLASLSRTAAVEALTVRLDSPQNGTILVPEKPSSKVLQPGIGGRGTRMLSTIKLKPSSRSRKVSSARLRSSME